MTYCSVMIAYASTQQSWIRYPIWPPIVQISISKGRKISFASPVLSSQRNHSWRNNILLLGSKFAKSRLSQAVQLIKQLDSKGLNSKKPILRKYLEKSSCRKYLRNYRKIRLWYRKRSKCGGNVRFDIPAGFCSSWMFLWRRLLPSKKKWRATTNS